MTPDELAYQEQLLSVGLAIPLAVDDAFKPSLNALLELIGKTNTPSGQVVRLGRFTTGDLDVLLVPNDPEVIRALVATARMFAADASIGTRLQIRAQDLADMILEATGSSPRRLPVAGDDEPRRSRPRSKPRSTTACAVVDPKVTPEEIELARHDVGKPKARVRRPRRGSPLSVSYGLGVDSTALLVGLAQLVEEGHEEFRPDFITFGDTGGEQRETYDYIETMNRWLESVGFPQVTVCAVTTQFSSGGYGSSLTLEQQCLVNQSMPSISQSKKAYAKCSKLWKQQAQNRWFKDHSGVFERDGRSWRLRDGVDVVLKAIGYDSEEVDRETRGTFRTKDDPDSDFYEYWYPLMDWGWNRARCIAEIEAAIGVVPPKSSCYFCGMAKGDEIRALSKDLLLRAILMEEVALRSRRIRHPKWLVYGFGEKASKKRVETLAPLREKYLGPWLEHAGIDLDEWDRTGAELRKAAAKWLRDNNKGIPQNVLMALPGAEGNRGLGIGFAWSKFAIDEGLITQRELDDVVETAEAIVAEAPRKKGVRDAALGPVLSRTDAFTDVLGFRSTGGVYVAPDQGDEDEDES